MVYYAVVNGRSKGIFLDWIECKKQVDKFKNAKYKKFQDLADAHQFLKDNDTPVLPENKSTWFDVPNISSNDKTFDATKTPIEKSKKQIDIIENTKFKKLKNLANAQELKVNDTPLLKTNESTGINMPNMSTSNGKTFEVRKPPTKKFKKQFKKFKLQKIPVQMTQDTDTDFSKIKFNENGYPIVYTDGACTANGRSSARAGIGVFWANDHPDNVSRKLVGKQTNNRAEIEAAIVAIQIALKNNYKTLDIHTDSDFMINSMTKWIKKWKRNGWKLSTGGPVKNQSDWKRFDFYQSQLDKLVFTKVRGHSGIYGNEKADFLARKGIYCTHS